MGDTAPACPAHRALVDAAMGEAPDDVVLERYAAEVATCPDCRRALSMQLSVHPAVLERGGADDRDLRGMRDLWTALRQPVSPSRVRWIQGAAVLAIAAAAAWTFWPVVERPIPPVAPPTEVVTAPILAPPVAPPPAPEPVVEVPAPAPAPKASAPPPIVEAPEDDAVADVDDWLPPPFEELRDGAPKALGGLRSVQLVLSAPSPRRVGDTVGLTVVASEATALAVCVTGPERGVVWRGGIPGGRISLTRSGRQQSFAFGAPGTYRFAVSTSDLDACSDPVHVVEVEVDS